jgi:hypothetical protein
LLAPPQPRGSEKRRVTVTKRGRITHLFGLLDKGEHAWILDPDEDSPEPVLLEGARGNAQTMG